MEFCPSCQEPIDSVGETCPHCGARTAALDDPAQGELFERVQIAKIPDEITGLTLKTMLMDQGVEAELQDLQGSFYGSVLTSVQGYWGKLFVSKADESRARDIVRDFMGENP